MQDSSPFNSQAPVDNSPPPIDNNNQDGLVEIIDRRQLVPIHDVDCKHENYVVDPSDETDGYISMVCSNRNCNVGYLLSK